MIQLILISNSRADQAFIDYMSSHDIEIKMTPEDEGGFILWLFEDCDQV